MKHWLCHKRDERALWVVLETIWVFLYLPWSSGCSCWLYKSLGTFSSSICMEGRKGIFCFADLDLRVTTKLSLVHTANPSLGKQQDYQCQTREGCPFLHLNTDSFNEREIGRSGSGPRRLPGPQDAEGLEFLKNFSNWIYILMQLLLKIPPDVVRSESLD